MNEIEKNTVITYHAQVLSPDGTYCSDIDVSDNKDSVDHMAVTCARTLPAGHVRIKRCMTTVEITTEMVNVEK